jgi:hypothetical protein
MMALDNLSGLAAEDRSTRKVREKGGRLLDYCCGAENAG